MGVTWTEPETAVAWVKQVKSQTEGLFQVNFVLHFEPTGLDVVLEAGAPIVTFSWGNHWQHKEYVERVQKAGAFVGVQVVSVMGAYAALQHQPDFLICQGVEAGGHVQSSTPIDDFLPGCVEVSRGTPIIGAGGIATGQRIREILKCGASGAMLGTRFVATKESRAHTVYKKALMGRDRTVLTLCFDGGWPGALHRVMPNSTLFEWETAGCPSAPDRPQEGRVVVRSGNSLVHRYEDTAPQIGMEGDIEAMCLYAGTGVGDIHDVPEAEELIERLWRETQA